MTSYQSRYFNAEYYTEHNFQNSVTLSTDVYYPSETKIIEAVNSISKTDVSYYPFIFMDTSAISVVDLGDSFDNYKSETERKRETSVDAQD